MEGTELQSRVDALCLAAYEGRTEEVKKLLDDGVPLNGYGLIIRIQTRSIGGYPNRSVTTTNFKGISTLATLRISIGL